jgi:hypothetical protein
LNAGIPVAIEHEADRSSLPGDLLDEIFRGLAMVTPALLRLTGIVWLSWGYTHPLEHVSIGP